MTPETTTERPEAAYAAASAALAVRVASTARADVEAHGLAGEVFRGILALLEAARSWLSIRAEVAILSLQPGEAEPVGLQVPNHVERDALSLATVGQSDKVPERVEFFMKSTLLQAGQEILVDAGTAHGLQPIWKANANACDKCKAFDSTPVGDEESHHANCKCEFRFEETAE